METIIDARVWDLMVRIINRNLVRNTNQQTKRRPRLTTRREVKQFYGVEIKFENSYGNDTRDIKQHFNKVKRDCPHYPRGLGVTRFLCLKRNFIPTSEEIQELCDILHETSSEAIENVSIF